MPYDAVVLGVGSMGSAAAYHLARRGARVLGIERFSIPNDRGSHHGVNRIIRLAYYEHPSYVPLLLRARELWLELEREMGERLLFTTGSVDAGPADGEIFTGSRSSCEAYDLPHTTLTGGELSARFPGYRLPEDYRACFQPGGGFLRAEASVAAHAEAARRAGAEIHSEEQVLGWEEGGWEEGDGGLTVRTDRGVYRTRRLVVTAGAWTAKLLPRLAPLARAERQVLGWFRARRPELFTPERFPVCNFEVPEGRYYGFPAYGVPGFKIGRYHHLDEAADPDRMTTETGPRDEAILRAAVAPYFPDANGPALRLETCLFTNSPDEHFLLDRLPDRPAVTVAAGFSGHGFKFCSVVGEILADLALDGGTRHDISLFELGRFGPAE